MESVYSNRLSTFLLFCCGYRCKSQIVLYLYKWLLKYQILPVILLIQHDMIRK